MLDQSGWAGQGRRSLQAALSLGEADAGGGSRSQKTRKLSGLAILASARAAKIWRAWAAC